MKKEKTQYIISDTWVRALDKSTATPEDFPNDLIYSNMTLIGVYEYLLPQISRTWKSSTTINGYSQMLDHLILPLISEHNRKIISDYTKEDFFLIIDKISDKGYHKNGVLLPYSVSTIQRIEMLIYYIVFYAAKNGFCYNVLQGTRFQLSSYAPLEISTDSVILNKPKTFFTPNEEKLIIEFFDGNYDINGEYVGFLLMITLGLRDAEAGGLTYGDIRPLIDNPEIENAYIYTTTGKTSNERKAQGKTRNFGRILYVYDFLKVFLHNRYALIEEYAHDLAIAIDPDTLPIACRGRIIPNQMNFLEPCSSVQISNAGTHLLKKIGIDPVRIAQLDSELYELEKNYTILERSPHAYIARKHVATMTKLLGLSLESRQYLIGHEIESGRKRSAFTCEDTQFQMQEFLNKRPLFCNKSAFIPIEVNSHLSRRNEYGQTEYHVKIHPGEHLRVIFRTKEVNDTLTIQTDSHESLDISLSSMRSAPDYSSSPDVRKQLEFYYE